MGKVTDVLFEDFPTMEKIYQEERNPTITPSCLFCGASRHETKQLIGKGPWFCDECFAELGNSATDYALKLMKAQDALKHSMLMRSRALPFEEAMKRTKEKYAKIIEKLGEI